ncbi:hypothetical protein ACFXTH_037767 [Malus domestica]
MARRRYGILENLRSDRSLVPMQKVKLGTLVLLDNLFAELVQLLIFGVALLLCLPDVLDVPKAACVPSLLVQEFQRRSSSVEEEHAARFSAKVTRPPDLNLECLQVFSFFYCCGYFLKQENGS